MYVSLAHYTCHCSLDVVEGLFIMMMHSQGIESLPRVIVAPRPVIINHIKLRLWN